MKEFSCGTRAKKACTLEARDFEAILSTLEGTSRSRGAIALREGTSGLRGAIGCEGSIA